MTISFSYQDIRYLHMVLVFVSVLGFTWRGGLTLLRGAPLNSSFWRRAPHLVDTALLASGVWLAWYSKQYPFDNSLWLSTKMLALAAYIAFGLLAVRYATGTGLRFISFFMALGCAWVMIFTAMNKTPLFL